MITAAPAASLHLTQILVSYEDAARCLKIRDAYDWHQRAWQAFGGRDGAPRDFLIRIDRQEEAYRVLILSATEPRKPDWCPTDCFGTKSVPEEYFQKERYRFSLLANPTRKVAVVREDGSRAKNGRRLALTQREELLGWIQRKAVAAGFTIEAEALQIIPRGREFFHKPGAHGTLAAVEFRGLLTVQDSAAFRAAVAAGIGSGKAFGFGLLALAPLAGPSLS